MSMKLCIRRQRQLKRRSKKIVDVCKSLRAMHLPKLSHAQHRTKRCSLPLAAAPANLTAQTNIHAIVLASFRSDCAPHFERVFPRPSSRRTPQVRRPKYPGLHPRARPSSHTHLGSGRKQDALIKHGSQNGGRPQDSTVHRHGAPGTNPAAVLHPGPLPRPGLPARRLSNHHPLLLPVRPEPSRHSRTENRPSPVSHLTSSPTPPLLRDGARFPARSEAHAQCQRPAGASIFQLCACARRLQDGARAEPPSRPPHRRSPVLGRVGRGARRHVHKIPFFSLFLFFFFLWEKKKKLSRLTLKSRSPQFHMLSHTDRFPRDVQTRRARSVIFEAL